MKRALPYVLPALLICGWWACTLVWTPPCAHSEISLLAAPSQHESEILFGELLSPLNRNRIKSALTGDTSLMLDLITEWDQDAQILESKGFIETSRLSRQNFIRALTLGRSLKNRKTELSGLKFYPQAWSSASLLLALADPSEIVALPEGYRPHLASSLPSLKGDPAEALWRLKPDAAFIAAYTRPTTIQTLENLRVPLHRAETIWSISDLYQEIIRTGAIIKREREAELMTLFMQSAFIAIDNRTQLLSPYEKTFYLNYGTSFSYPTKKMISGQLADRLKLNRSLPTTSPIAWKISLDQEQLIALQPKRLILSCEKSHLPSLPYWEGPIEIALIDQTSLESLDQTIVLAYYDLFEALSR